MKARVWAKAFIQVIEAGKSPKEALENMKNALKRQGKLKILPKILLEIKKQLQKQERRLPKLTVANEKALDEAKALIENPENVKVITDDTLIGGYIFEKNGHMIDKSFKRALLDLYRRIVKSG